MRYASIVPFVFLTLALMTLATRPISVAGVAPKSKDTVVRGRIVKVGPNNKWFDLKAGRTTIRVNLGAAKLQKHKVAPLQEVSVSTELHAFARLKQWSDAPDELQQIVVLVAGDYDRPPFVNRPGKAQWHKGSLRFGENKTVAWCGRAQLYCGVDRPVCSVEKAQLADYFETKKSGDKKPRMIFVRGKLSTRKVDGKKQKVMAARVVTLPGTGIKREEYSYILDPAKLHAKFKAK